MSVWAASAWALACRELLRAARRPTRVAGTIGTPLLFWVVVAAGFGTSFRMPPDTMEMGASAAAEVAYGAYLAPGMASMVVVFGATFAAISLIQDRHSGFLQAALVSRAPRGAITAAKVAGGAGPVVVQAAVVLAAGSVVGLWPGVGGFAAAVAATALLAVGVVSIGLAFAWWVDSVPGFHGVMSLVLVPAWLVSGALFPIEGASGWMAWVMRINPVHWAHVAVSSSMGLGGGGREVTLAWIGTALFALVSAACAWMMMCRPAVGRPGGDGG